MFLCLHLHIICSYFHNRNLECLFAIIKKKNTQLLSKNEKFLITTYFIQNSLFNSLLLQNHYTCRNIIIKIQFFGIIHYDFKNI